MWLIISGVNWKRHCMIQIKTVKQTTLDECLRTIKRETFILHYVSFKYKNLLKYAESWQKFFNNVTKLCAMNESTTRLVLATLYSFRWKTLPELFKKLNNWLWIKPSIFSSGDVISSLLGKLWTYLHKAVWASKPSYNLAPICTQL